MTSQTKPIARWENIVVQELGAELLIYDLKKNKAFCLNETAARVWMQCDGNKTVSDISRFIIDNLKSPASKDLVWLALDELKRESLLVNSAEIGTSFGGMSRREVIRKVGLASMVVLPAITSLLAPTSAIT